MLRPGYIYILRNPYNPNTVVKIGRTKRTSEGRAQQLSRATGVPWPFEVLYEEFVVDAPAAEKLVHARLKDCRVNQRREFFDVPLKDAVRTVFNVSTKTNAVLRRRNTVLYLHMHSASTFLEARERLVPFRGGRVPVGMYFSNERASCEIRMGGPFGVRLSEDLLLSLCECSKTGVELRHFPRQYTADETLRDFMVRARSQR